MSNEANEAIMSALCADIKQLFEKHKPDVSHADEENTTALSLIFYESAFGVQLMEWFSQQQGIPEAMKGDTYAKIMMFVDLRQQVQKRSMAKLIVGYNEALVQVHDTPSKPQ